MLTGKVRANDPRFGSGRKKIEEVQLKEVQQA
jgi:hypothetical protein